MSDEFCPRQISFLIPGNPAVRVTATEDGGAIQFTVDVQDTTFSTADLRALFFDIADGAMAGLTITSTSPLLTESRTAAGTLLDLGGGANLNGATKKGFDVGLEWGTPGGAKDDINFAVGFTLTNSAGNLTLDDIAHQRFGAVLDSIGGPGGVRNQVGKLIGIAPAAPDAVDDSFSIYEDGAADTSSPSKTPTAVTLTVLANDTDADPADQLTITAIHEGPSHGTVTIAADGKTLLYTPDLDYSGTDSFYYCVSDGNGGQDNALCTVNIEAVADDPLITWTVAAGANINEVVLTVTATQNDADGSEYLDRLDASVIGGIPAGSTVTPLTNDPAGQPGQIVQQFLVTTPAGEDTNFDLDFTARAVELSNGDDESATETQNIEIDFTHNQGTLTYEVVDQSIWSTGDEFVYDLDEFFGVDESMSGGDSFDVLEVTVAGYAYEFSLKAGFQVDVHFEGGGIDATVPVDVTVDSTYNKTTDTIYLTSAAALASGGSFLTHGPEGAVGIDLIFNYYAYASAFSDIFGSLTIGPYGDNLTQPIVDLSSFDPAYVLDLLGSAIQVGIEWPHISVANDPGTLEGSGASNNMLFATLDVDALANLLLGGSLSWIDSDPTTESNFEIFDLDIVGGINLLQEFALSLAGQSVTLVLEDGTTQAMTLGSGLTIENASSHDLNGDGHIGFSFDFSPNLELTNKTEVGANLTAELAIVRNLDLGVTTVTVYDQAFPIAAGPIATVFEETFALNGVGTEAFAFIA